MCLRDFRVTLCDSGFAMIAGATSTMPSTWLGSATNEVATPAHPNECPTRIRLTPLLFGPVS